MQPFVYITECPRDAMQGIHEFIPTTLKQSYLNQLLQCGFDILDYGSFVSAKAIPQLVDTPEITPLLPASTTKLLAIVANVRGAETACTHDNVDFLGFPFSISETFQLRNTNSTLAQSFDNVLAMQELCSKHNKQLRVYLSMAFGNPYGDKWNTDIVLQWAEKMQTLGINHISLADTVGSSTPELCDELFSAVTKNTKVTWIAHLHSTPETAAEKVHATLEAGCRYFDTAIKGYGGCPMATDKLTGNIATETLLGVLNDKGYQHNVKMDSFNNAMLQASEVFSYH